MIQHQAEIKDEVVLVSVSTQAKQFLQNKCKYDVRIVVNNSMYTWNAVDIEFEGGYFKLMLNSNPKVVNRRKHPRLPMKNACEIKLKAKNRSFHGRVVNISAGGFAFSCREPEFANAIGEQVEMTIQDFPLLNGEALKATIIRSTNDRGSYIVGCRMSEDHIDVMNYVKERMTE